MNLPIENTSRKWWVFFATSIVMLVINIDMLAVNLALAPIAKDLHFGIENLQWVINSYMIAIGVFIITGGLLADIFGQRKLFIIGTIIFGLSSGLVAFADTLSWIVVLRILQGIGCALALPASIALLARSFPVNELGFAMGLSVAVSGFSQAIGPFFGGYLLSVASWRWIFIINFPICIIAILAIMYGVTKQIDEKSGSFNLGNNILLLLGLFGIFFGLNRIEQYLNISVLLTFVLGVLLLVFWSIKQIKDKQPDVDLTIFKNSHFLLANFIRFLFQLVFFSVLFLLGIYLINILGYSPIKAGTLQLFMSVAFGVLSIFTGKLADRIDNRLLIAIGMALSAISCFMFANLHASSMQFLLISALIIFGFSIAIIFACTTTYALATVPQKDRGAASGIFFATALIGGTLGVTITGFIMRYFPVQYLLNQLAEKSISLTQGETDLLTQIVSGSNSIKEIATQFGVSPAYQLTQLAQASFYQGFYKVMLLSAVLSAIGFIVMLIFRKKGNQS